MLLLLGTLVIALGILAMVATKKQKERETEKSPQSRKRGPIIATQPLTSFEQPMYFRLTEAFPLHVVLAQVAFGALLTSKSQASRGTFIQKRADFVICSKAFEVIAIIELDDSSHRGREQQDADRDAILTSAGYKVFRYKLIPDIEKLRNDIEAKEK